ncbi:MAG: AAA family ATPase [Syntrophorhabdales bacterium]|jgi:chromosome segregation protein
MKLTTLELLGFKSFLNRTTLRFDDGVTCIVGPNGCGKSNIVDAITWVLGERGTKSLRVKEMGDVIFHGSSAKKQVNMAEVTLGLMNEEREYAIRRRIYRDGTNEYYINGDVVRLKDIQDFLLGTGIGLHSYAIIEQGNIEYFTQMKPHERRIAVEETSGITRFEEKKKDAFFRMEEVKANLERVEDMYGEVARNHERAEEESARLQVYNDLRKRLREFDIAFLVDGHGRLAKKAARLEEREEALAGEIEANEAKRHALVDSARSKGEEIGLIDSVTRQMEVDIKGKEKDMESRLLELTYLDEERRRLQKAAGDLRGEIDGLDRKISLYSAEVSELTRSIGVESAALAKTEQEAGEMEAQRKEQRSAREALEGAVEEERDHLFGAMTRLTEVRNGILERERMLKERQARRQRRIEEERLLSDKLRLLEEKVSSLRERMEDELAEKARVEDEEKAIVDRYEGLAREAGRVRNEIEGLKGVKRGKEEVFRQMKSYAEAPKRAPSPYKQLIDILRCSKETEHVMERFFPREMEYRVLTEEDPYNLAIIAKEYKENFVFFPKRGILGLDGGEVDVRLTRVDGLAEAFRRIGEGEEGLFLSGNVIVDSRGFVRRAEDRGALSIREFREKTRLESELARIGEHLRVKSSELGELLLSQKDFEKRRQAVQEKRRSHELGMVAAEREIINNEAEIRTTRERLKERASESEAGPGGDIGAVPAEEIREKERWEKEKDRIERLLADLKKGLEEAKGGEGRADAAFHRMSIAIERGRNQLKKNEEEAGRKKSAVGALRNEKGARQRKVAEVEQGLQEAVRKAGQLEAGYRVLQEDCARAVTRYEEMKARLGGTHAEKAALEEEIQALGDEGARIRVKKEGVERERLVLQEKRDAIRKKLREEYGVEEPVQGPGPVITDEAERETILEGLAALGDVNFRAWKESAELKERLEFLEKQKADLTTAMESLRKTITKIDSVSRELFLETFERVNEAFKGFTHTLFKGGQGALMLNRETNGIDLYVQPPGKKVTRIELLSGGEKALISLSFLLSLMNTKPSPFTLMDEIDAPLDDANLVALLEIVKTISRRTQIIIITHNRLTMEFSNTLYGITTEEAGVSKTISIRLQGVDVEGDGRAVQTIRK